ncbi:hypothetical protein LO762_30000 [Actinocorallia sp. API 0066]|uniref:hypothetical protein n=1 Tax=Actinocorallia sp. API 0066 TaxID=2896846 RepID=UPI001E553634|nr:hypothetical protein [Actinocorallia sp. API 0066]MCD0453382.1 hypothetical protein [Actinocorallia sp. API 0066]
MSGSRRDGDEAALDSLVVLVAENLGYSCTRVPGDVMLLEGAGRLHVGMRNLRQLARLVPRDDWPAVVADHVTTIITAIEEPLDLSDFSLARHLLRTRVYPAEADNGMLAARPFAPGLIEVVVVDTPTTVRTVTREEMAAWPAPMNELFALGRDGVHSDGPLQRELHEVDGMPVHLLHGWTFYAATHLAWLEQYLELGTRGALVAVPNRSTVIAFPLGQDVGPGAALRAAAGLKEHTRAAYEEGPGSLSPALFWWRDGDLALLETRGEGADIVLPGEFLAAMAGAQ